jgi:hypothetical protein
VVHCDHLAQVLVVSFEFGRLLLDLLSDLFLLLEVFFFSDELIGFLQVGFDLFLIPPLGLEPLVLVVMQELAELNELFLNLGILLSYLDLPDLVGLLVPLLAPITL